MQPSYGPPLVIDGNTALSNCRFQPVKGVLLNAPGPGKAAPLIIDRLHFQKICPMYGRFS
ncbi:hypothetical protein D3C73_1589790 [compost metagenome]